MSEPIDRYFGQTVAAARAGLSSVDHFGTPIYGPLGACIYCRQALFDGGLVSGWTHAGPDLCTEGGDFGCNDSPDSDDDGVGGHALAVIR